MRQLNSIVLFIFIAFAAFSGNKEDSLRKIIKTSTNDSLKVMAYTTLSQSFYTEPSKALEVLNEMNIFCEKKLKSSKLKALCLSKLGVTYGNLNYYDKALEFTFRSAELFEKMNDKDGLANCYNNIGSYFHSKGNLSEDTLYFKRSIEYHLKAIQIRMEINDTSQLHNSYNNIGGT